MHMHIDYPTVQRFSTTFAASKTRDQPLVKDILANLPEYVLKRNEDNEDEDLDELSS